MQHQRLHKAPCARPTGPVLRCVREEQGKVWRPEATTSRKAPAGALPGDGEAVSERASLRRAGHGCFGDDAGASELRRRARATFDVSEAARATQQQAQGSEKSRVARVARVLPAETPSFDAVAAGRGARN